MPKDTGLSLSGDQYDTPAAGQASPLAGNQYEQATKPYNTPLKLRQELGGGPQDLTSDERAAKIKSFGGKTP